MGRYQLPVYEQWLKKTREDYFRRNVLIACLAAILRGYLPMVLSLFISVEITRNSISGWTVLIGYLISVTLVTVRELRLPMKKPLVLTMRARRLLGVLAVIYVLLSLFVRLITLPVYLVYASVPYAVWLAGRIMDPVEERINAGFYNEARKKLRAQKGLIRIGITGSYGKTLTKFILKEILSAKYEVLATPASFNTAMGISRVINDQLEDKHQVFIAEMGAQHLGDIRNLVRLVHPQFGLITAIGPQHIDTFGSIANIMDGKYELIEGLPENGVAFFASDSGYSDRMFTKCKCEKYSAAVDDPQGEHYMSATDLVMDQTGMAFTLTCSDGSHARCHTRLLGRYNVQNIALAAAVAHRLGLTMDEIRSGISKLQSFEKKLQLIPGDRIVIDDTLNEMPIGAAEALNVLAEFTTRRVIVTPGLPSGEDNAEEINYAFGAQMKGCVDLLILVGEKRQLRPIIRGAMSAGIPKSSIRVAADFDVAEQMLDQITEEGDVILYESRTPG